MTKEFHSTPIEGPQRARPPFVRQRAWFALVLLPLLLGACAGARISNEQSSISADQSRPTTVAVRVTGCPPDLMTSLGGEVIARLQKAGIPAWRAAEDTQAGPDLAILDLAVTRYDPGNRLEQAVIGFGAGRSHLDVDAALILGQNQALRLSSDADSGRRPGLILPGGVAAATGDVLHLAIGGGLVAITQLRGGPSRDVRSSADLLADRTVAYFQSIGWTNWGEAKTMAGAS